jgi:hypothetical protein
LGGAALLIRLNPIGPERAKRILLRKLEQLGYHVSLAANVAA